MSLSIASKGHHMIVNQRPAIKTGSHHTECGKTVKEKSNRHKGRFFDFLSSRVQAQAGSKQSYHCSGDGKSPVYLADGTCGTGHLAGKEEAGEDGKDGRERTSEEKIQTGSGQANVFSPDKIAKFEEEPEAKKCNREVHQHRVNVRNIKHTLCECKRVSKKGLGSSTRALKSEGAFGFG